MEIFFDAELEIRTKGDGRSLRGAFPYNKTATIRDRGRVRKERFKSGAFGWQIEEFAKLQTELAKVMKDAHAEAVSILKEKIERRNVNLLSGHDFNRPLASMKAGTLAGWELPDAFPTLRRLLEARMGKAGKREYVQVLRLLETFDLEVLHGAVKDALRLGAIGYDAVKHLVLCRIERRPPKLDLDIYPYLPRANVATTAAASYMSLLGGGAS